MWVHPLPPHPVSCHLPESVGEWIYPEVISQELMAHASREVRHQPHHSATGFTCNANATCVAKTVSSLATRLAHFGRYLAAIAPDIASLSALARRPHIEPFIAS